MQLVLTNGLLVISLIVLVEQTNFPSPKISIRLEIVELAKATLQQLVVANTGCPIIKFTLFQVFCSKFDVKIWTNEAFQEIVCQIWG